MDPDPELQKINANPQHCFALQINHGFGNLSDFLRINFVKNKFFH
jgi:hypothetical protein